MKILTSRKNKDYYDYLTGIYGIDEKVVFDRRQFTVLTSLDSPFFNYQRNERDKQKTKERTREWIGRKCQWVTKYVGTDFHCLLEVGLKWYFFKVERYLDDSFHVCIDWNLAKTKEISKNQHLGTAPMIFFKAYSDYSSRLRGTVDIRFDKKDIISNPIIVGTPITSLVMPEEVYNNLYAYISSLNDVDVVDNRTDIQKAESAGFDRKTSFRNIK